MRSALILVLIAGSASAEDRNIVEWVEARGASARSLAEHQRGSCPEVAVGPNHEPALVCTEFEELARKVPGKDNIPVTRVLTHRVVRVVRDKKLVTLIDVPVKSEPFDGIPRPVGEPAPPDPFVLSDDGMTIVVDSACTHTPLRRTSDPTERVMIAFDRELEDRICKARGRYVWTRGTFTVARKT